MWKKEKPFVSPSQGQKSGSVSSLRVSWDFLNLTHLLRPSQWSYRTRTRARGQVLDQEYDQDQDPGSVTRTKVRDKNQGKDLDQDPGNNLTQDQDHVQ